MRFYVGIGKRIHLKTLLKLGLGILMLLGIYKSTLTIVHAASFETVQNWSTCDYGTTDYASNNCTIYNSSVYVTSPSLNNVSNVLIPNGAYEQNPNLRQNKKKTEIYKYGGVTDCASGSNINLYVDAVMGGYNGSFADNVLDPNQFPIVTTRGVTKGDLRATCPNTWCDYWPWLSNSNADSQNKTGVRISKTNGVDIRDCTFVSYGSNKSVRFLCSVPSGNTGYQIILNEYNNGYIANTNLMSSVGIKTTVLSDPCKQYPNDQSGVIGSIGDQTSSIVDGFAGIIDNQNVNQAQTHQDLEDIKDKIDDVNDNIDQTNDKLDQTNDTLTSIDENTQECKLLTNGKFSGYLNSSGNVVPTSNSYFYTDYLRFTKIKVINNDGYNAPSICFYDNNKNLLSCEAYARRTSFVPTIPQYAYYFRASLVSVTDHKISVYVCNGIGDILTDSDLDLGSGAGHYFGDVNQIEDTPISSLLLLPINYLQKLVDTLDGSTCIPYSVPFGITGGDETIDFPCIDLGDSDHLGSSLWGLIDNLFCIFMIYKVAMMVISYFEDWTSLHDTFDQMYHPDNYKKGAVIR